MLNTNKRFHIEELQTPGEAHLSFSVCVCMLLSFRVALAWIWGPPTCVNLSVALCNS